MFEYDGYAAASFIAPPPPTLRGPEEDCHWYEDAVRFRSLLRLRSRRDSLLGKGVRGDPPWDMLLELWACYLSGHRASITGLTIAAKVPPTTGLRWLEVLFKTGMVGRREDPLDRRRVFAELTAVGVRALENYFEDVSSHAALL